MAYKSHKHLSPTILHALSSMHTNHILFFSFFFKFYFIFKFYIIVLVLPNIKMNPPQVYILLKTTLKFQIMFANPQTNLPFGYVRPLNQRLLQHRVSISLFFASLTPYF